METGRENWTSSCLVSVTPSDLATCGGFLISATGMVEVGSGHISYYRPHPKDGEGNVLQVSVC